MRTNVPKPDPGADAPPNMHEADIGTRDRDKDADVTTSACRIQPRPVHSRTLVIVIQWLDQCRTSSARIVPAVYSPDGTTLPLTVTSTWLVFVL